MGYANRAYIEVRQNIAAMKHIRTCMPKESLVMVFRALVDPHFRYYNTTWGGCRQLIIDELQALQNRAARVVDSISFDEANHNLLLRSLGWLNIGQLLHYDTAMIIFKVSHGLALGRTQNLFQKCDNFHSFGIRAISSGNLYIP